MTNPQQLVLRRDTATGLLQVGWAMDMPPGRFLHIELIGEASECAPLLNDNPLFDAYQRACQHASSANTSLINQQCAALRANGWSRVPFELCNEPLAADEFGSFQIAGTRAMYLLTANVTEVWAVMADNEPSHIQSRLPDRPLAELEYQVWRHHTLNRLNKMAGSVKAGRLVVKESGLWFFPT